jgi:flavin reductase (DIM6/NTAB) family NADH-FMN oxidoreductase RutF
MQVFYYRTVSGTAVNSPSRPADDLRRFRRALGCFPTGVTVVTASAGGRRVGVTANSFSSVSLDPPLVLWSLYRESHSLPAFRVATHFAVNVLAHDQQGISERFCTPADDRFAGLEVTEGPGRCPVLPGCSAVFACRWVAEHEGGDHVIIVGEVESYMTSAYEPLVFCQGGYHRTQLAPVPCKRGAS